MIHPESISKMFHIIGIFTDHISTSQLDTIKSQVPGERHVPDPKERHKEEQELHGNWLKMCYLLHIMHPQSIFPIFLITFLNSDIDLLHLTILGNPFQIKDPRKSTELVP